MSSPDARASGSQIPGPVMAPPLSRWQRPRAGGLPASLPSSRALAAAAAAAGTLLREPAAAWLCSWRSAAPHLSRLGPTRMRGVGVRRGRRQVRRPGVCPGSALGPQPAALLGGAQGLGTKLRLWESGDRKAPAGAGRKAVNTIASGHRSRKYPAVFFLSCLPNPRIKQPQV